MENQMLFYSGTKSLEVSMHKLKCFGREGRETVGMATVEREVKGAR